ncbi:GDYXXLXY domain-containing protein [Terriglobus sp. TAA 43]|uniref:GDYXXLXY domain-containing protein n=1 Tax=Terriglobus sp. TAA 43 TaxID=278961 RepID=UPI0006488807|nr:GDYXXLXY domain-containing protein [Terriglobus sp. TAA 43]
MTLSGTKAAVTLLVIQSAIALSVAGTYALDRITKPRVWVRTQQFDPSTPLRGRYLALQLAVDGCSLPTSGVDASNPYNSFEGMPNTPRIGVWPVTLSAESGHLTVHAVATPSPDNSQAVSLWKGQDCHNARLDQGVNFFLPEHAASPVPQSRDASLWVEVTVPSNGPPRPIQIAVSDSTGWHVLKL